MRLVLASIGYMRPAVLPVVLLFLMTAAPAFTQPANNTSPPASTQSAEETIPPAVKPAPADPAAISAPAPEKTPDMERNLTILALIISSLGIIATIVVPAVFHFLSHRKKKERKKIKKYIEKETLKVIKKHERNTRKVLENINARILSASQSDKQKKVKEIHNSSNVSPLEKAVDDAIELQEKGKIDDAIEKWQAIADIAENHDKDMVAKAWFSIAYLSDQKMESAETAENRENIYKEIITAYDKVVSLKPDFADAYINRGYAKLGLGKPDEAILDFNKAIMLNPDAEAYNNRGVAWHKLGQHDAAILDFDKAIILNPDAIDVYNNRGLVKDALEKPDEAILDFNKAISFNPYDARAYFNRGITKENLGKHDEAILDYDEAVRLKSDFVEAYVNRGNIKARAERYIEAILDYDEAIKLDPYDADTYFNRGNAKLSSGRYDEAILDFDEAIKFKPNFIKAYFNSGAAKAKLGKYETVRADFEQALKYAKEQQKEIELIKFIQQEIDKLPDSDKSDTDKPDSSEPDTDESDSDKDA